MNTIDFTRTHLQHLITHRIGNKIRDEGYFLSRELSTISENTIDLLLKYFLLPLKTDEIFSFSHPVELNMNEVYTIVSNLFISNNSFVDSSHSLAKLLYEQSMHPRIKEGELNIAYFENIVLDDEVVKAIGIFKSETNVPFIQMDTRKTNFEIRHNFGYDIKGMDKGCVIFNTDKESGYRIIIVDNANKSGDAQYWKDDYLGIKPISNDFYQTNQFIDIAKDFVLKHIPAELDVNKAKRIDILNRSVEYFKTHDNFDKEEFEQDVFKDVDILTSFRNFDSVYRKEKELEIAETFGISSQAVKKQAKIIKRVLKLDKNFDIYIHGSNGLIEQGIEKDGRKYYKIYFEKET